MQVDDDAQALIELPLTIEGIQSNDEGNSSDDHELDEKEEDVDSDYNQNWKYIKGTWALRAKGLDSES